MTPLGLNPGFFVPFVINLLVVISWIVLAIVALRRLRAGQLDDLAQAVWAIFIVIVPIGGAVAMLLVQPGTSEPSNSTGIAMRSERSR